MSYFAISTNTGDPTALVEEETARLRELLDAGTVQRYWVKADWSGALLLLPTDDEQDARATVDGLPIARAGLTRVDLVAVVDPPDGA